MQAESESKKPKKEPKTTELEQLEPAEKTVKTVKLDIFDETGTYTEEDKDALVSVIQSRIDTYANIMFTCKPGMPDYTETLLDQYGTSDYFADSNKELAGNAFKEMQGLHMESKFEKTELNQIIIRKDVILPEVSVIGTIYLEGKDDRAEQGRYAVPFNFVLLQQEDSWLFYSMDITRFYKAEGYRMTYYSDDNKLLLASRGKMAHAFDFANVEMFLNDYKELKEDINEKDYDEVR